MSRGVLARLSFALISSLGLASTAAGEATEIRVLSNRVDLVSGGDALVEVKFPAGVDPATAVMKLGATDVTAQFAVRPNGRYLGLLTGLAVGTNELTALLPDQTGAQIAIRNHPNEGPVFSGPHLVPWECRTEQAGFGAPDVHCNAPPLIQYHYQAVATPGSFQPYDPENPPPAPLIRTITTDQGNTVPYIVRHEIGSINRGIYAIALLYDPSQPSAPWAPPTGWNGKLFYPFGASCGVNYNQGDNASDTTTPNGVLDDRALSRGFAVATASLNILGHHCDTVKSAETVMMVKERIIEQFGEIRYTFGEGFSGGSIGQLDTANAYPGLLQGLIPGLTYPDVWTTAMDVADCVLLDRYFNGPGADQFPDATDRLAVEGHGSNSVCQAWIQLFGPLLYPDQGCNSNGPDYDAQTQPDGCRSTVNDIQVNVWGRRAQDGFAKRPFTNDGTQFGFNALNAGQITVEQFLHLNENLGGADIDSNPTAERTTADLGTSLIAYSAARVNDARGLAQVAIIDLPSPENAEIHTPYHAFSIEQRLIKANGTGDNHAIWRGGVADPVAPAFVTMDAWLTAVEDDTSNAPLPQKIIANRPAAAADSCFIGGAQVFDQAACDAAWPYYASTRIAAGSPFEKDIIQCALKPPDPADYAVTFDTAQWQRLQGAFPRGVCDWSQPGQGQVPSQQWVSYENGPGGQPLGPPPTSVPLPEPGALLGFAAETLTLAALSRRQPRQSLS